MCHVPSPGCSSLAQSPRPGLPGRKRSPGSDSHRLAGGRGQRVPPCVLHCCPCRDGRAGAGPSSGAVGLPARVAQDRVRGVRPGRASGMWWPREGDTQQRGLERATTTRGMVGSGQAAGWVPRSRVMLWAAARDPSGDAASPRCSGQPADPDL